MELREAIDVISGRKDTPISDKIEASSVINYAVADGTLIPADQNKHSDDEAVDRFAVAMKAKLAKKRADGRGGWDNPGECSAEFLSKLLREHVEKGDPLDVGNLAMMLHQRGDHIHPADQVYEVREGYKVQAHERREFKTLSGTIRRGLASADLSEALSIRSADEVRREALEEAINRLRHEREIFPNIGYDDAIEWIESLIDTPPHLSINQ